MSTLPTKNTIAPEAKPTSTSKPPIDAATASSNSS